MKPYTLFELEKCFNKVSMVLNKNGKHITAQVMVGNKLVRQTHYSHGRGGVGEDILQKIKRQLDLDTKHFIDLVDCPLDRPGLLKYYKEKGYEFEEPAATK